MHVFNLPFEHVQAERGVSVDDFRSQVSDDFGGVVASVVTDDIGELAKGTSKCFHSKSLFALEGSGKFIDGEGHAHLSVSATIDNPVILDGCDKDTDGIM